MCVTAHTTDSGAGNEPTGGWPTGGRPAGGGLRPLLGIPNASPKRIKALPSLVASQIAAGEVVERPASVVKELVENALDAGAKRIVVELVQGGIELVRVADDGSGMPAEDLPLAVMPHATSKIADVSDLDHIATLGFRGEALASIASVSRLSIRSRTRNDIGASVLTGEGDRFEAIKPMAGPVGTETRVKNLFFNTPARRKFLRTPGTEQERCVEVVKDIAMAHAGVGFVMECDGRKVLDVPMGQTAKDRVLAIVGIDLATQILDVSADAFDDARGVTLWGVAGLPSIARGTAKAQRFFVNGRAVRDRTIMHAVNEAYRGLVEPGRYPMVVLLVEMSPEGVDVNVHPGKAEVRFRDSSMVHSVVYRAVREALQRADLTPTLGSLKPTFGGMGSGLNGGLNENLNGNMAGVGGFAGSSGNSGSGYSGSGNSGGYNAAESRVAMHTFIERLRTAPGAERVGGGGVPSVEELRSAVRGQDARGGFGNEPSNTQRADELMEAGPNAGPNAGAYAGSFSGLAEGTSSGEMRGEMWAPMPMQRVLQVHKSYLVTQDEQGVVIIDQHALHERVMFEYLLERVNDRGLESQRLLAPAVVKASPIAIERLGELKGLLTRLGLEAEAMGPTTVAVHAFPTFLFDRGVDEAEFVSGLLERASDERFIASAKAGGEEAMRDVLDMMACKAAVKAGDKLSDGELMELTRLRDSVERSSNCPHGRPTSVRLTIRELDKLFGRG